jgi:signal transduction histidine kinase
LRANRSQQSTLKILGYKHKFSLELMPYQNWDSLVNFLAKCLAEMIDAKEVYLSLLDPLSQTFEIIAEWKDSDNSEDSNPEIHNFPILYKSNPYARIRFLLKPGHVLNEEKTQMLENVSAEVIAALMAGQDRKKLSELEFTKATLAERQAMSHYLHDNLGQNIGYLRMKLDQFINQPNSVLGNENFKNDLIGMKDIADQSYRLVRNKLEDSIPDSTPLLANYLQEHARKVSHRSKIEVNFTSQGISRPVSVELQRAVFYVFQEALSNVEKHAEASRVDIGLDWGNESLNITIKDNGKGFNINNVLGDKHFGLEIMRERMAAIGGTVEICSAENSGTSLKINTLTTPIKKTLG